MSAAAQVRNPDRPPVAVLESLLDDAARTAVLREAAANLEPGLEPPSASRLQRVHIRSDQSLVAEVAFVGGPGPERQYFIEIPSGDFAVRAAEIARRSGKQCQRLKREAAPLPSIYSAPALGLFVRPRGVDEAIDGLALLDDQRWLADQLPSGEKVAGEQATVGLLAHRLNRRAVLGVRSNDGTERIVKLYKKGSSKPQQALTITSLLERTSLGKDSPVGVPQGMTSLRSWPGYVMDRASGVQLDNLIAEDNLSGAALAGAALGRIHRLPLRLQQTHTLSGELAMLRSWTLLIADVFPSHAHSLRAALRDVGNALLAGAEPAMTLVHRDFHGGQVLVSENRATLIDFDTACNGEPAQDVGNFLGHLDLARAERSGFGEFAEDAFLAGYADAHRGPDAARVAAHRRATRLRLACIYAFSDRHRSLWPCLLEMALGGQP